MTALVEPSASAGWRPLAELGAILLAYEAAEGLLAREAAAWASLGEVGLAERALFGALGDEALERATAWRALAEDLAGPLLGSAEAALAPLVAALATDLRMLEPTVEVRLAVVARAYLPRLATAYRVHRATAWSIAEGPVTRQLGRVLPALVSVSEEAEELLENWCMADGPRLADAMRALATLEERASLARLLSRGQAGRGSAGGSEGLLTAPLH